MKRKLKHNSKHKSAGLYVNSVNQVKVVFNHTRPYLEPLNNRNKIVSIYYAFMYATLWITMTLYILLFDMMSLPVKESVIKVNLEITTQSILFYLLQKSYVLCEIGFS